MTTPVYCSHTGSNTSPYETKAKAATTLTTALAAATTAGDIIYLDYTHTGDNALAADTTYTATAGISIISIDFATDIATPMGTAAWLGSATLSIGITLTATNLRFYTYGLTLRNAGSTNKSLGSNGGDGAHLVFEDMYFWVGTTNASAGVSISLADSQIFAQLKNPTFQFGATGQLIRSSTKLQIEGGSISSAGSAPTVVFSIGNTTDPGGCTLDVVGFDASHAGSGTLVAAANTAAAVVKLSQCKLGTGYVMLDTQTHLNRSGAEVYVYDCAAGDTHGLFGYANAMGSVVSDTGIYFTAGAAAQSWKIVTTANCSFYTPFETPWFGYYNSTLSALTPYVEILRDGSATAYQDNQAWADFLAKVTTTSTQASLSTDRMTLNGTAANQAAGAGLGSWTGESGTAWSGKLGLGASITPAEVGHISARIVVGAPSVTVYADPQIRT